MKTTHDSRVAMAASQSRSDWRSFQLSYFEVSAPVKLVKSKLISNIICFN